VLAAHSARARSNISCANASCTAPLFHCRSRHATCLTARRVELSCGARTHQRLELRATHVRVRAASRVRTRRRRCYPFVASACSARIAECDATSTRERLARRIRAARFVHRARGARASHGAGPSTSLALTRVRRVAMVRRVPPLTLARRSARALRAWGELVVTWRLGRRRRVIARGCNAQRPGQVGEVGDHVHRSAVWLSLGAPRVAAPAFRTRGAARGGSAPSRRDRAHASLAPRPWERPRADRLA
jgi:hypothetical protein